MQRAALLRADFKSLFCRCFSARTAASRGNLAGGTRLAEATVQCASRVPAEIHFQCWSERGSPPKRSGWIHGGIKAREIRAGRRTALGWSLHVTRDPRTTGSLSALALLARFATGDFEMTTRPRPRTPTAPTRDASPVAAAVVTALYGAPSIGDESNDARRHRDAAGSHRHGHAARGIRPGPADQHHRRHRRRLWSRPASRISPSLRSRWLASTAPTRVPSAASTARD